MRQIRVLGIATSILVFAAHAAAAVPPWYVLHNQLMVAIGADQRVRVDSLDATSTPYRIDVHVADGNQACALASVLTRHYDFGGVPVDVRILDGFGEEVEPVELATARQVAVALQTALGSSPFFVSAFETPSLLFHTGGVGVVFKKVLLQYRSGDIGELYGNTNAAAAEVFGRLLIRKHGDIAVKLGTLASAGLSPEAPAGVGSHLGRLR